MIGLAALLMAAAAASAPNTIPAQYQGHFTTDPAACGGEDTNGVHITATTITFYEARGAVRRVTTGAGGASASTSFNGEGRQWRENVRFRPLANGGVELVALGRTTAFTRCAA